MRFQHWLYTLPLRLRSLFRSRKVEQELDEEFQYHLERQIQEKILREDFLIPLNISEKQLADHIGCDFKVINRIVNSRAQVTPKMAIKLAAAFNTSPDFWLNSQKAVDIYNASRQIKRLPKSLLKKVG